jgi:uncharacterized membrane protein YczE
MKKLQKTGELTWLLGNVFVALGVTICSKADLGVSMIAAPAFVLSEALYSISSWFSVGVTEYIIQGILLVITCLIVKKFNWRYLLAFVVAVLYGYTLNFFIWLFNGVSFNEVWLRWVMLLVGDAVTAFGVACFFRTYMPLQVYELTVAEIANKYNLVITKVKGVFDAALLVISIILALTLFNDVGAFNWSTIYYASFHSIGLGTIVTTLINSTLIKGCGLLIDAIFEPTPLFPKLEKVLKRN